MAFYARRYLARHDLPAGGLAVEATFQKGARAARVAGISLRLIVPEGVPAERLAVLPAVASRGTVHTTLESSHEVSIALASATGAADSPVTATLPAGGGTLAVADAPAD